MATAKQDLAAMTADVDGGPKARIINFDSSEASIRTTRGGLEATARKSATQSW